MRKMAIEENIELLEREILFLYKTLSEYGYFMGDLWPRLAPWHVFEEDYEQVLLEAEPWVVEGALLLALTVLWGNRDGAHSISNEELSRISLMTRSLRPYSERTAEIARAIDSVEKESDEGLAADCSRSIYQEYVVGYLKNLADLADGRTHLQGHESPGRPSSFDDAQMTRSGAATPSKPKGR
jgi:hypothetical protein